VSIYINIVFVVIIVKERTLELQVRNMRGVWVPSKSAGEKVARKRGRKWSGSWLARGHQRRDERTGGGRRIGSGLRNKERSGVRFDFAKKRQGGAAGCLVVLG